ncbi:MAG: Hsp20/alpha crystallin family protein [Thermoleophilia bacterium]
MDIDDLHSDVLRAFDDICAVRGRQQRGGSGFRPLADAFYEEASRQVVVRFELPGMERDEISLLVDRRQLAVRGERRFPVGEGRVYQQVEMDYGPFERRIRLTVDVDPDATTATYEAGVLEVRLTLVEREGARQIKINAEAEE